MNEMLQIPKKSITLRTNVTPGGSALNFRNKNKRLVKKSTDQSIDQ